MPRIQSFPFSADARSKVLILGSMPGVISLEHQEYYAHPRNLFWDIMGELFQADRKLLYEQRLAVLLQTRIALWDVAHSCQREGSLDSNMTDVQANDFSSLLSLAPEIHTILFNGQKAAALFQKFALPHLDRDLTRITLPSTSPANASMSAKEKHKAWKQVQLALERSPADANVHKTAT